MILKDYRDIRKGAYQQYVVSLDHTLVRLPPIISYEEGSTLGVAFVASAIALGFSIGIDFSSVLNGPNLFDMMRNVDVAKLPADIRVECVDGVKDYERLKPGDWLAMWGGRSSTVSLFLTRLQADIQVRRLRDIHKSHDPTGQARRPESRHRRRRVKARRSPATARSTLICSWTATTRST